MDQEWTNLVYAGLWIEPLIKDLEAFIDNVNKKVTGRVSVKLYKGNVMIVGRDSPYALYDLKLSSYNKGQLFNQTASKGFIEIWGLQSRMAYNIYQTSDLNWEDRIDLTNRSSLGV